jgi:hypothetical protein
MADFFAVILVGCMPSLPLFAKTVLRRGDKKTAQYDPDRSSRYAFSRNRDKKVHMLRSDKMNGTQTAGGYITIDDERLEVRSLEGEKVYTPGRPHIGEN